MTTCKLARLSEGGQKASISHVAAQHGAVLGTGMTRRMIHSLSKLLQLIYCRGNLERSCPTPLYMKGGVLFIRAEVTEH